MTDLGTLGLTGSGFEVAAPDVADLNGFVGTTADASAVSTGRAVEQLKAESNINLDLGARYKTDRVQLEISGFVNRIDGNIQKQTLILPQGAVGTLLGTEPITAQNANGAVFVAVSSTPVLVRANFDEARIWGMEWTGDFDVTKDLTLGSTYTYLKARDLGTNLPPNIEGGTPAPGGTVSLRYAKSGQRWWVQPYVMFAQEQSNLSSLDLGDRRTGANRTRGQIQNFFRQGARVRGWISPGPDGVFGNADDLLIATNETLTQVQDRVLGAGVNGAAALDRRPELRDRGHPLRPPHRTALDPDRRIQPRRQELPRHQLGHGRTREDGHDALCGGILRRSEVKGRGQRLVGG